MENFIIKNDFISLDKNPLDTVMYNINKAVAENHDLSAIMQAGCKLETNVIEENGTVKIVIRSVNKVSILKSPNGSIVGILEQKI